MAWNTPATRSAGDTMTAAIWNAQVRDNLNAIGAAAVAYTPTITNVTNSTVTARAWSMGKQIEGRVRFTLTAAPTGVVSVTLPTTASTSYGTGISTNIGSISGNRGGTIRVGAVYLASSTTMSFISDSGTGGWANGVPSAWANTDTWEIRFTFEAA